MSIDERDYMRDGYVPASPKAGGLSLVSRLRFALWRLLNIFRDKKERQG